LPEISKKKKKTSKDVKKFRKRGNMLEARHRAECSPLRKKKDGASLLRLAGSKRQRGRTERGQTERNVCKVLGACRNLVDEKRREKV